MSIKNIEYMCKFSERLLEERKRLGLNQDKMAEIGGVAKRTYCNYESGEREPMGSFFTAIAAKGADVQYILTGIRSETHRRQQIVKAVTERIANSDLSDGAKREMQQLLYGLEMQDEELIVDAQTRLTPAQIEDYLSPREAALLENYQQTDEHGKRIIEATASQAAQPNEEIRKQA